MSLAGIADTDGKLVGLAIAATDMDTAMVYANHVDAKFIMVSAGRGIVVDTDTAMNTAMNTAMVTAMAMDMDTNLQQI